MTHDTHRRTFLKGTGTMASVGVGLGSGVGTVSSDTAQKELRNEGKAAEGLNNKEKVQVAGIATTFFPISHADVQLGRMIYGYNLDGSMKGFNFNPHYPDTQYHPYLGVDPGEFDDSGDRLAPLDLVSLYTDQVHDNDLSRPLARRYPFDLYDSVKEALTLGTGELAVDAVYMAIEHGDYPQNELGIIQYPKRRLFEEVIKVFEESGEVVPVFLDKFLGPNLEDALWIYQKVQEMDIPFMAGSSLPVAWRSPWDDGQTPGVEQGSNIDQAVCVGLSDMAHGGYHGLEYLQSLVEQRAGGESGVTAVESFEGDAVWTAGETGVYDRQVLLAALSRQSSRDWTLDNWSELRNQAENPKVGVIEYSDGLKGFMFSMPSVSTEYSAAWRYDQPGSPIESAQSNLQSARPYGHHGILVENVQKMFITGEPVYPAERTLLSNAILIAILSSLNAGERIESDELEVAYQSDWSWEPHAPSPPNRSIAGDFPPNFPWNIPISFGESGDVLDARYDDGDLSNGQYNQLSAKLSTAEQKAKQGKADQANNALDQFIATASSVADGQTSSDLVEMAENLQENRVPELEEILA